MTRIGFYVHHHGSGHVTRAVEIARHCTDDVVGFSTLPRPAGWPGDWVDLADDAAPADGLDPHAGGVLHWAPVAPHPYAERMRTLAAHLDVDLLHVYVSVEVTLAARLLGVPVVVSAMRGDRTDRPHRAAYDAAALLLAPWPADLPEPGWEESWRAKCLHVGGISRFDGADRDEVRPEPGRVFALWGRGGGDFSDADWDAVHTATPGWTWHHGAEADDVWDELHRAEVVVAHAGQNSVAEVAAARRPAVVVGLDRPHGEQLATVRALREADLAEVVDASAGAPRHDWAGALECARRRGGAAWSRWSDGHGGHRAARALEATARGRRLADRTAVVTLVHGRHDHLRGLVRGLADGEVLPERFVVVAMGDPGVRGVVEDACRGTGLTADVVEVDADAGALPLARARNLGARTAADLGCPRLIFLDVDCIPGRTLVGRYADVLAGSTTVPTIWSGPVAYLPPAPDGGYDHARLADLADPHPARPAPGPGECLAAEDLRLFWSLSFAVRAEDYAALGGFDEGYSGYGGEDTDFAMRLQSARGRLWWLGGAEAYHQYHPTSSPPVQHLHDIVRNANRFADVWGWFPMEGWLSAFAEAGSARLVGDRWVVTEDGKGRR